MTEWQNDRMTHINIGRSFVILNFNHSVSLKGIPSEKFEKYANKFYFSKYENRQSSGIGGTMGSKLFWSRTIIFYAFGNLQKHLFLYLMRFLSTKNFKSQTYSNWVACTTEKKTLATFIVRGNQIWVEACFCLIASIRLVDGKKPQDAKIVKSEEAPPYNGKTLLQVIFNQIDTFFF